MKLEAEVLFVGIVKSKENVIFPTAPLCVFTNFFIFTIKSFIFCNIEMSQNLLVQAKCLRECAPST